jgi:hypothetical protein
MFVGGLVNNAKRASICRGAQAVEGGGPFRDRHHNARGSGGTDTSRQKIVVEGTPADSLIGIRGS